MAAFASLFLVLLALFPTTGFFDLYLLPWQTRTIFLENANFWQAMRHNPAAYLPFTHYSAVPYGPLFYYPLGLWIRLLDAAQVIDLRGWNDLGQAARSLRYTAALKVPNFAVYLAIGFVLLRTLPARAGVDAMMLWLFNPAVILVSFVMGQNDSWSMLAVLGALLLARLSLDGGGGVRVGRLHLPLALLSVCLLGAGAAVKIHPLLFVMPFAAVLGRSWPERIGLALAAVAMFGALVAPFIGDSFFRAHALFNPQGPELLQYKIGHLPLFYPLYGAATLFTLKPTERPFVHLLTSVLAIHLLIFLLTDWPPERAAWFIGALAPAAALHRTALVAYVLATVQVLLHAMTLGVGLGAGAFAVISPRLANGPGLNAALDRVSDFDAVQLTGLSVTGLAWAIAIALMAFRREGRVQAVPLGVPVGLLMLLPVWFAGSLAYTSGGVTTTPYSGSQTMTRGPATVEQPIVAGYLSAVDLFYDSGPGDRPLEVILDSGSGAAVTAMASPPPGSRWVRLTFPGLAASPNGAYVITLRLPPGSSVGLVGAQGTSPSVRIDGSNTPGSVLVIRLHYDRRWGEVWGDVTHSLEGESFVLLATALLLAPPLVLTWHATERRLAHGMTGAEVATIPTEGA
jgi:hypothetical protein